MKKLKDLESASKSAKTAYNLQHGEQNRIQLEQKAWELEQGKKEQADVISKHSAACAKLSELKKKLQQVVRFRPPEELFAEMEAREKLEKTQQHQSMGDVNPIAMLLPGVQSLSDLDMNAKMAMGLKPDLAHCGSVDESTNTSGANPSSPTDSGEKKQPDGTLETVIAIEEDFM